MSSDWRGGKTELRYRAGTAVPVAEREPEVPLGRRVAGGALRGAIAAMAMTGVREFTRQAGLLGEAPPEAIVREKFAPGWLRRVQKGRRRAAVELLHWSVGAMAGAGFAALPRRLRRHAFGGPIYGLLVWTGFQLAIAPAIGLSYSKHIRAVERLALSADHLLYGFVLSETCRREG